MFVYSLLCVSGVFTQMSIENVENFNLDGFCDLCVLFWRLSAVVWNIVFHIGADVVDSFVIKT